MKENVYVFPNTQCKDIRHMAKSPNLCVVPNNINDSSVTYGSQVGGSKVKGMLDPEVAEGLRGFFDSECAEVGRMMAMSRKAAREGLPKVAQAYRKIALEEAEHAAKFAELLEEESDMDTKADLDARIKRENGTIMGKLELAKQAKTLGYDTIHKTVRDIARDEARHGCAFMGLLKQYFKA